MNRLTPDEYHVPVMLEECMTYLNIRPGGMYVDATLGGGGHTKRMLELAKSDVSKLKSEPSKLVSFDADEVAIERAKERFKDEIGTSLAVVHANFSEMPTLLRTSDFWTSNFNFNFEFSDFGFPPLLDGVLFDLGVSSFQFDHHERGFSYRQEAPLDMRFSPQGKTAADILNTSTEKELVKIIREYGEDPNAFKLAQAITRKRGLAPYKTTYDLRDTIVQHVPPQYQAKVLSRVFQALRIAVNKEIEVLESTLNGIIPLMNKGGRIVVMSYHSLEDRVVKSVFKKWANKRMGEQPNRLRVLTKKPIMASDEEVARNSRARSARLRVAEAIELSS